MVVEFFNLLQIPFFVSKSKEIPKTFENCINNQNI